MCFLIPVKIKSIKNHSFTLDYGAKNKEVKKSLILAKKGDYVLVQNGVITRKIPRKQALEILELIS